MPTFTKVSGKKRLSAIPLPATAILLGVLVLCRPVLCQQVSVALIQPAVVELAPIEPTALLTPAQPATLPEVHSHRFWDRENSFLFATSAAFNAADFVVTRDILQSGGRELNPVTRLFSGSTAGLAVNFAGETATVVALSYLFHKTGHHKLERFVSVVNIGSSAGAVTFDLAHR